MYINYIVVGSHYLAQVLFRASVVQSLLAINKKNWLFRRVYLVYLDNKPSNKTWNNNCNIINYLKFTLVSLKFLQLKQTMLLKKNLISKLEVNTYDFHFSTSSSMHLNKSSSIFRWTWFHLNSGIRNGRNRGPGLNCCGSGDFVLFSSTILGSWELKKF